MDVPLVQTTAPSGAIRETGKPDNDRVGKEPYGHPSAVGTAASGSPTSDRPGMAINIGFNSKRRWRQQGAARQAAVN